MISLNAKDIAVPQLHAYLLGAVGPRPIAFASTINLKGEPNLAPFSFFNVFSANPPVAVFSPSRSGRTGSTKHTYDNVREVPEVVLNIVNYKMVQQMSLASSPYAKGVDEFVKAGFEKVKSDLIAPFRVKQSPVTLECKVTEIKELGQGGGAGNLVICEVLRLHISEDIIDEKGNIDQKKIDLVARMGGNWYCRASGNALFEIEKPITTCGIGIDQLPEPIRTSKVLSGNNLGLLASVEHIPEGIPEEARDFSSEGQFHHFLRELLDAGNQQDAWSWIHFYYQHNNEKKGA